LLAQGLLPEPMLGLGLQWQRLAWVLPLLVSLVFWPLRAWLLPWAPLLLQQAWPPVSRLLWLPPV
jgi:hypothetical protein